ncbi:Hsp20/alpha crystallin family protein [Pseudonocardia dioxanivorans]|uniref:Hsp20/alpha crystallin family protein n=1 Tax=Pseudonocardia dioxanivorans TaxID=240495 RepID=UPI000A022096
MALRCLRARGNGRAPPQIFSHSCGRVPCCVSPQLPPPGPWSRSRSAGLTLAAVTAARLHPPSPDRPPGFAPAGLVPAFRPSRLLGRPAPRRVASPTLAGARATLGNLRKQTRPVGRFECRLVLPAEIDRDRVGATLSDGVLRVRVPKCAD